MRIWWAIVLGALVVGCDGGSNPGDDGDDDGRETVIDAPATPNRDVDILFMIDDSPSMADKQQNLANNFPNFINTITAGTEGLPNLHLGVISSDMGTSASTGTPGTPIGQLGQGGCAQRGKAGALTVNGAPVTEQFIVDVETGGARQKNYTGELAQVFGQMARLGPGGCGFEQPLAAIKAALDNNPSNAGFLRPDALLAIVMLTDEDDCSAQDPGLFAAGEGTLGPQQSFRCTRFGVTCSTGGATPDAMNQVGVKTGCTASTSSDLVDDVTKFHDFITGLKADPSTILVAAIAGTVEPFQVELRAPGGGTPVPALAHSCTFQGTNGPEVADPPVRIQSFLDQFPGSVSSSICQADLSGGLAQIGERLRQSTGTLCITQELADVSAQPELQVDCIVEDLRAGDAEQIPPCDAGDSLTCWQLEEDPTACPAAQNLKLVVVRDTPPALGTRTRARCVVP
jgi:hypothetical protein